MIVFGVCSSFSIQPLNQNAIFYHCQNVIDKEINWSEYDLWSRPHPLNLCEKKDNKCRKVFGKENKYTECTFAVVLGKIAAVIIFGDCYEDFLEFYKCWR